MLKLSSIGLPITGEAPGTLGSAWSESPVKIAHKTNSAKNRLQDSGKNRPQDEAKNRPDIILPVRLAGVVGYDGLKALLIARKQMAWCSRVRLLGLLLLIDYVCRKADGSGGISISADLAHQFVSKLRKKDIPTTITEPLLVLSEIGIFRRVRAAVHAHVMAPAAYRFEDAYRNKQIAVEVRLTPKLARKRATADVRCERRLNRKFPWRETLLADLRAVSFSGPARLIIARGLSTKGGDNLRRLVSAVDGRAHSLKVSERGQITTSIGSCPRELLPHLLLDGEPIVSCDISNAHWNFLPLILANRLDHVSGELGREGYVKDGRGEHNRLAALLSDGDFYRAWCVDPQNDGERDEKKTVLNMLLNKKNEDGEGNVLYRRIRAEFPITFRTIEDIKRNDHRNLSKQLHRFTADTVEAALLEIQREGIAAIPYVDALICQEKNQERVCKVLGKEIFAATGVCSAVGGVRYSPLTEVEAEALAFDDSAPSADGMSYDEWGRRCASYGA